MTEEIKKPEHIKIVLVKQEMMDRVKGKIEVMKDPNGEIQYVRNDIMGLMRILGKFDSRNRRLREFQTLISLRDKVRECYLKEKYELELTVDEYAFLKGYLKDFNDKEGKENPMAEFELRTYVGLMETFEKE